MRQKRRMTAAEFEAVRPLLNISQERIEAARLALVDGQTLQSVANNYGWTRQAVGDAVGIVWKHFERFNQAQQAANSADLPAGWEQATLAAPKAMMARFRSEAAEAATKIPTTKPRNKTKKGKA